MAEDINEQPKGLWHNIRAKRARGEKPAQKGTKAYKDVQKAIKKINAEEGWDLGKERYKVTLSDGTEIDVRLKEGTGEEGVYEAIAKQIASGVIPAHIKIKEIESKASRPTVNEAIKYKKGKTYQKGNSWTVYMSDGSAHFDIRVNNSAGWSTDPHDRRGETLRLLDAGKTVASLRFKEGNINAIAKKMYDLNGETTWGEREGLKAKDYADIIRVWISMGMEMNESVNEMYDEYDTSGVSRSNLKSFLNYLDDKDISYSMERDTIEFDVTELDRKGQKIVAKLFESINEAKVNYDFSEDELKRVLKLLGRNASTEIKMIKAFEKAFGRKLTRDELFESVNEAKIKRGTKITYTKHFQFGKQGEESAKVVAIKGNKILLDNGDELNAVDIAMNKKDYKLETIDNNAGMPTQEQSLEEAGKPTFNKLDKVKVQNVSGPASKYNGMKGVVSTKPMSYSDGSYGYMVRLKRGRKVAELEFRENELVKETVTETRLTPSKYSDAQKAISKYVKAKADDYQILDPNRDGKRFDVGLHNTGINQKAMMKTLNALLKKLGHKKVKVTAGEIFSDDGKYYEVSVDLKESSSNNLSATNDTVIVEEEGMACPIATQDVEVNTKQRDAAIAAEHIKYGPLNVNEPGDYWEKIADKWETSVEAAKQSLCGNCVAFDVSPRMDECMPGETSDDDGRLGYCWMHHFKCHSARTCNTWAKGGPIGDNDISYDWQSRSKIDESKSTISHDLLIQIINEELDKAMAIDELQWNPSSGTKSGGVHKLTNRKYLTKKDIENVNLSSGYIVTLPKGTEIVNLPGGVFAKHKSLKRFYETPRDKEFGVLVVSSKETLKRIQDKSKVLESELFGQLAGDSAESLKDELKQYVKGIIKQPNSRVTYLHLKSASAGKKVVTLLKKVYGIESKVDTHMFSPSPTVKFDNDQMLESVNEAARVDSSRYKRSHGKDPKGYGMWLFSFDEKGDDAFGVGGAMNYTAAKKLAAKKAKEAGKSYVYVMESNQGNNMNIDEGKYRVTFVTKDGEKGKSRVFNSKKEAEGHHYKLAKTNKLKTVDVVDAKTGKSVYDESTNNLKEDIAKIIREELANIIVNEDIRIDTAKDIKPSIVSFKDAHNINEDDTQLDQAFHDAKPVDEASPQMKVDKDAQSVGDMISMLGAIGRRASGSNVKKELVKAIKVLQSLRSSIQVGR